MLLQFAGAIAIAAGPWLGSVGIAAVLAGMGVLDAKKIKILFPIRPFLLERRGTKTNLHPRANPVGFDPGIGHIAQILVTGYRALAQRA